MLDDGEVCAFDKLKLLNACWARCLVAQRSPVAVKNPVSVDSSDFSHQV
jgi:hypothetical protein